MTSRVEVSNLKVDQGLYELICHEVAPGTGIDPDSFWQSLSEIVTDLAPGNRRLLEHRDELQAKFDTWYVEHKGKSVDRDEYRLFLEQIGYLVPEGDDFEITTTNVDEEIALVAGPQLVVPVDNARYALNAANARWGSLYDALYGTNVIPDVEGAERGTEYNPVRGAQVITQTEAFLDEYVGLDGANYSEVTDFLLTEGSGTKQLSAVVSGGRQIGLSDPASFVGYRESDGHLANILLRHHGLGIEIQIDPQDPVGKNHPAGVKDVILESAITTIQDCEDSVSAVDALDKTRVYRNWLGIMKGTLECTFSKAKETVVRRLNRDKSFTAPDGLPLILPGRSLLLVRNVGIHMYTDAVTTQDGKEIPEGFLDAMVTALTAIHDLKSDGEIRNSRAGSVYIVKPKLHGPHEVAATVELFGRIESAFGLEPNTLKIGIMDEERRTTINLKECIHQARQRVVFINTGFLDRTGDEIHTNMAAGAMIPKMEIKNAPWMLAYEDWNVDIGNQTGLPGRAQIGKGMWTMPDEMHDMVKTKIVHPAAGGTTARVPSPTAATLHAMHYHQVNVAQRQSELAKRPRASLNDILSPPLLANRQLSPEEIQNDLDNNAQGILGYVVRWVDQGIGCSKVPDLNDVGLMEDRATLRISSQHLANWLYHGITNRQQVIETFQKMAATVDDQNSGDPAYFCMAPDFDNSPAFQAALDLVFRGRDEPNGYTENVLTTRRRQVKASGRQSS